MKAEKFHPPQWIKTTNIYEVNTRQYTPEGTFNAFSTHLPRLKDMGVETLWFMPITPIAQKNKKGVLGSPYACSDYFSVNPELGTLNDFIGLVKQAHDMGFKVILDWVANHTGWDHKWTIDHPEYYLFDTSTSDFKMASGMEDIIELDFKNTGLRQAMTEAMQFWTTNTDVDGFRCDLAFWVELDFWKQARASLEKDKALFWLGEFDPVDNPEYFEVFDAAYTWTWMHKTEDYYKKNTDIEILATVLGNYNKVSEPDHFLIWFTSNHDENSWNGTEFEKYGNMAKSLAVFSLTWKGLPMIYSGQELPNTKRLDFFAKDAIPWNGKYELHEFYKKLLTLRKARNSLLAEDKMCNYFPLNQLAPIKCLGYLRVCGNDKVVVLLNWSSERISFCLVDEPAYGKYVNIFSRNEIEISSATLFELEPWDFLVFEVT